jgi:glyoxylase-like metal-dependent hydrolase (beta-lactamase superfamily II)
MPLKIETIVNGPFQENCYLVWDDATREGIFIDPGDEPGRLLQTARFLSVEVKAIYNTHGHIDHAGAVAAMVKELKVPFALHGDDEFLLESIPGQARMFGLPPMEIPAIDVVLADGDTVSVGGHEGTVIHTPGHTPGGVCFHFGEAIFVGDTLFAGSIGRSDLPGGSHRQLIESIKTRLLILGDSVRAYSGHGPVTTIGEERAHNPFLNGRAW